MKVRLIFLSLLFLVSCKPYQDPQPFTDPRIVNKYCNIPSAINYNWNFPGIPEDSVCVFPAQIYNGTYFYRDSIFNNAGLLLDQDSFLLTFTQLDTTRLNITGFCAGNTISATASRYFKFNIDTIVGYGQLLCQSTDTIYGRGSKLDLYDTLHIKMSYEVATDTGIIYHAGTATKQ